MVPVRAFLIPTLSVLLVVVLLFAGTAKADPMPVGDSGVRNTGTIQQDTFPAGPSVKNPHVFSNMTAPVPRCNKKREAAKGKPGPLKPLAASQRPGRFHRLHDRGSRRKGKEPSKRRKHSRTSPGLRLRRSGPRHQERGGSRTEKRTQADVASASRFRNQVK